MHKFLRAIGFSEITKKELDQLMGQIIERPMLQKVAQDSEGNEFAELSSEFGDFFGLSLRGTFHEDDSFDFSYYYPYYCGNRISTMEPVEIEKHAEKESYAGICDDVRLGVTLIFYLQNVPDYLAVKNNKFYQNQSEGVILGALSTEGKVLLPVNKTEQKNPPTQQNTDERNRLIAEARNGNEDAIENLTLEDMDTYSMISRRIAHEDVFSIVSTYFMPYGVECDHYNVLGEILDCNLVQNSLTKEWIYVLTLESHDLVFEVCINKEDLLGEPEVGRRFKGVVWMQGEVIYHN